jgi:hypothetical protein
MKENEKDSKMMNFAFSEDAQVQQHFLDVIKSFCFPDGIPNSLRKGYLRLIYLIALHFGKEVRKIPLPIQWQQKDNGIISKKDFFIGLNIFICQLFRFNEIESRTDKMSNVLHTFFSPHPVPRSLTKNEARLLYIIAMHFDGRPFRGVLLPKEWKPSVTKNISDKEFYQGLNTFIIQMIETGGLLPITNTFAKQLADNGIRKVDQNQLVQVAKFIGV